MTTAVDNSIEIRASGDDYPYFRVDAFYKVLGEAVRPVERSIFEQPDSPGPSDNELRQILALSVNWDDQTVPEDVRERFLEKRWILGKATRAAGQIDAIDAIMTISLDYAGPNIREPQENFRLHVLPELISNGAVTSVYEGTGIGCAIDYVLRVTSSVASLFGLIDRVHQLSRSARVLIRSSTSVVLRKLADLSLEDAILVPALAPRDVWYVETHILPYLKENEKANFRRMPEPDQLRIISYHQMADEALNLISDRKWMQDQAPEIRKRITKGLLQRNFEQMREPHDILQGRVETILGRWIDLHIPEEEFGKWKKEYAIAHDRKHLSYRERIRIVSRGVEEGRLSSSIGEDLVPLVSTITIRNALVHQDWERLTMEDFLSALLRYCQFIARWEPVAPSQQEI